jgi:GTPase Era involved in 16S rRNA processing
VFLQLTVKVLKNWMGDDDALKQAGLFKNFSASSDLS